MTKPTLLVYPSLGAFAGMFASDFDLAHLPEEPGARAAFLAGPGQRIEAAVGIGSIGVPAEVYELPKLKLIACFGVGYDGIDLPRARARRIAITNCPNINHGDVADVAIGLILSCTRNIAAGDRVVRAGAWTGPVTFPPPRRLRGQRLGIVGLGAIGLALADRARAFGLTIAWTGPRAKPNAPYPFVADLLTLARDSDILALTLRPDPGTQAMVNAAVLDALGPDGLLINVARGSVVDEDALIAALKSGRLGGAGLDVFAQEPTPAARWADVSNVTLTPHVAGATRESILESAALVLDNLRCAFAGQPLKTPVP
ncbi:MAG: 2-hydroxyacid dehydrogenase [Caulobacterales bacterium]